MAYQLQDDFDVEIYLGDSKNSTSINSTAVISSFGTTKGNSEFGDSLVDSFDYALNFYQSFASKIKTKHYYFNEYNKVGYEKRFSHLKSSYWGQLECFEEEIFLIDPDLFIEELKSKIHCKVYQSFYTSTFNDDIIYIDCTGYHSYLLDKKSKSRQGSFYEWEIDHSFYLNNGHFDFYGEFYLSVRKEFNKLILGSTTVNRNHLLPELEVLKNIYEKASEYFTLPDSNSAMIRTGIRELGHKRKPFYGQHSSNIWSIHSLYKNGWTLAPYFSYLIKKELFKSRP